MGHLGSDKCSDTIRNNVRIHKLARMFLGNISRMVMVYEPFLTFAYQHNYPSEYSVIAIIYTDIAIYR